MDMDINLQEVQGIKRRNMFIPGMHVAPTPHIEGEYPTSTTRDYMIYFYICFLFKLLPILIC